jgi:hypothetical protein
MATHLEDDDQPMSSTGTQSQQEPAEEQSARADTPHHGSTGEGSGSAMARLISQEQSRVVPGAPDDAPNGSS